MTAENERKEFEALKAAALAWCKKNDGGRLCVWLPAGGNPDTSYPIMAVNWDHGGTGELGTFYGPEFAPQMELICDVFNWALEQLAPSSQGFYGDRNYSDDSVASSQTGSSAWCGTLSTKRATGTGL